MKMETPIQQLMFPEGNGVRLFCKREDLLPFSLGGNKVRIGLQFYRDMMEKKKDCMVVYGNSRSNLCRVLANLCASQRIPCYMICSREEHEERTETSNSRLMKWLEAEIIPCEKDKIASVVEDTMNRLEAQGSHPYYIYGNKFGTGNEGIPVQAYVDGYREIRRWEEREGIRFSHIFTASGTGATQSGLISGKLLEHGEESIVGISISSREYERAVKVIKEGISSYFSQQNRRVPKDYEKEIILETAYRQGGYGQYDHRIMETVKQEFIRNGIPMDPTYTGKAFWGMKEYLKEKNITDGNVLFLHTGGTPLFYDLAQSL